MQLLSTKTQQVEWRRDRVLELSSQGFSQSDIVTMLKVVKVDKSDGTEYKLYCKTDMFEEVRPQIMAVQLAVIDSILEEYRERKKRQSN
jgi:hypothetical protein